jgi:hypothetical protein
MNPKHLRKRIYVCPAIQGQLLKRLTQYWIFYHLGVWTIMFTLEASLYCVAGAQSPSGPALLGFCKAFVLAHWGTLVLPAVLFPIIVRDMMYFTHQIAGPLVRFRNALALLAAGQHVDQITLRDGDLLTEFQQTFNEFLESGCIRNDGATRSSCDEGRQSAECMQLHQADAIPR